MRRSISSPHVLAAVCLLGAIGVAAGCGGGRSTTGGSVAGDTLTVYSSLPQQGPTAARARSIIDGEKLALRDAGGRAGPFTVKFQSLDDSTPDGTWDPGAVSTNARAAATDTTTIAYLGEMDSGASAISIPITNQSGILQVSPIATYAGLTSERGAAKGEPDKYYPTAKRNFARVIPNDLKQAAAQAAYQQAQGCTSTFILAGKDEDGTALATNTTAELQSVGIKIAGNERIDDTTDVAPIADKVAGSGADCVFSSGPPEGAAEMLNAVHAAVPTAKLFGWSALGASAVLRGLQTATQAETFITSPILDAKHLTPAGRRFFARYRATFGRPADPAAIYGYAAMSGVLDAIRRAGPRGNDRQTVIDQFFATKDHPSVLGPYSITKLGDTTLAVYGAYTVADGALVFDRVIAATPSATETG